MIELACTPGQTVGPFLGLALPYSGDSDLVGEGHPQAVRLHGTVYDGAGDAVPDALVELWQPDCAGRIPQRAGSLRRDGTAFTGWGRCATDAAGHYGFTPVAPGPGEPGRAPFFAIAVFARGLLDRLFTRAYLPHDDVNADPALASLMCVAESGGAGYRFDIHLQGPNETVFLAFRDDRR
jgi:protocatechuate 3,4-dioxygenase alpha subunit